MMEERQRVPIALPLVAHEMARSPRPRPSVRARRATRARGLQDHSPAQSGARPRVVEFMKSPNYRLLFGKTNPTRADRTIYQKEIFGWKRPDHSMFVISSMAAAVSAQE